MEVDRIDERTPNQLRPLSCSRNILNRAHGSASWSQGINFIVPLPPPFDLLLQLFDFVGSGHCLLLCVSACCH